MSHFPSDEQAIRAGKKILLAALLLVGIVGAAAVVGEIFVLLTVLDLIPGSNAKDLAPLLAMAFALLVVTSVVLAFAWLARWQRIGIALGAWFGALAVMAIALSVFGAIWLATGLSVCAGGVTLAVVLFRRLRRSAN